MRADWEAEEPFDGSMPVLERWKRMGPGCSHSAAPQK